VSGRGACVIGAGVTGLAAARGLKEAGIEYEHLERDQGIGGNWRHGVYDSTRLISSRDSTGFTGFPMPRDYPDFPTAEQFLAYLDAYADHFGLRERIQFGKDVVRVEPLDENGMAGWRVELAGGETREYDVVVVCNGHHWDKRIPEYPGSFDGHVLHAKDYRNGNDIVGDRVAVVGMGNSGCDIAVESARARKRTVISVRRGVWLLPKTFFGVPQSELDRIWLPVPAHRALIRALVRVTVGRYERYGLQPPQDRLFDRHATVNSELLYELKHGSIDPRPGIERLDGRTIHFVDGSTFEADTLVWATGYHVTFPFLPEGMFEWERGYPKMIAGMLPPGQANLYLFGVAQPRGGAGPVVSRAAKLLATMIETQARLDHPLADDMARLRAPEARDEWGGFEIRRRLALAERVVRTVGRVRGRRPAAAGASG
jgi:cation diffusion facilitator CzcD-associated flavoprotein CzcO